MIRNPRTRRILSVVLMALGGLLLVLVPADLWIGSLLLLLAVAMEAAGMVIQHRTGR